jgi:hypothetical protein
MGRCEGETRVSSAMMVFYTPALSCRIIDMTMILSGYPKADGRGKGHDRSQEER